MKNGYICNENFGIYNSNFEGKKLTKHAVFDQKIQKVVPTLLRGCSEVVPRLPRLRSIDPQYTHQLH